ncbi:hypothetical protein DFS33DRAFT_1275197 [Desarmillaria ectypa]|nr:hypothetical protein DFS33DRAFT_1275197 [Desarmillaria ectypa]
MAGRTRAILNIYSLWSVVKTSNLPNELEVKAMLYVAKSTTVPIPYIQDYWTESDIAFGRGEPYHLACIVMDYIPDTLEAIWPALDTNRKTHITPTPELCCAAVFILSTPHLVSADFRKRLREDHRIVFTHADLVRRNIIIGANDDAVAILDWAMAVFMPEQWEYLKILWVDQYEDNGWKEFVSQFLDTYPKEFDLQNRMQEQYGTMVVPPCWIFALALGDKQFPVNLSGIIMSKDTYAIAVAHKGAGAMQVKHWSILIVKNQLQSKKPQDLSDVLKLIAYMGMEKDTSVTLNNTSWNPRNWAISALQRLQNEGCSIEAKSLTDLLQELDEVVKEEA